MLSRNIGCFGLIGNKHRNPGDYKVADMEVKVSQVKKDLPGEGRLEEEGTSPHLLTEIKLVLFKKVCFFYPQACPST